MHSKLDILGMIRTFLYMVETQFSTKIKIIRTDNALDFFSSFCKTRFQSLGIVHQSSCPYTPQQNGVVERKHGHILNVARSLRIQSSVPLRYWGDCVLTAVYIINRAPTHVLHNKTPFEILFHKAPAFNHLRTFGCLCYSSVLPVGHKFSPRAHRCVFLGYSGVQKGHKVLDLQSKKVFVSRYITFHENISFC